MVCILSWAGALVDYTGTICAGPLQVDDSLRDGTVNREKNKNKKKLVCLYVIKARPAHSPPRELMYPPSSPKAANTLSSSPMQHPSTRLNAIPHLLSHIALHLPMHPYQIAFPSTASRATETSATSGQHDPSALRLPASPTRTFHLFLFFNYFCLLVPLCRHHFCYSTPSTGKLYSPSPPLLVINKHCQPATILVPPFTVMFPYLSFTIACKLIAATFDLYVTRRQHANHAPHHPPSPRLARLIPLPKFAAAQQYCRAKSAFQLFTILIETALESTLLLTYFLHRLWTLAAPYSRGSELRHTLVFFVLYGLVATVLDLPTSLYSTFVLEVRFGFNRTTPRTFVSDLLKQLALSVVLGLPMVTVLFHVLRFFAAYSPVTVAAGLFAIMASFLLFMMVLYPSVIAPLFNKFTPLEDGVLKEKLVAMAASLRFPLDKMYVIDGSRRSSHSNAFVFGIWRKYICIYDSLLDQTDGKDEQVVSVLCHELGHWYHSHTVYGLLFGLLRLSLTCAFYALAAGNVHLFKSFGFVDDQPVLIGLLLLSEVMSPLDELWGPLGNSLSRYWEYQADAFARKQGMAEELGKALVGMSISNLSNMSPDRLYSTWNYSHPTLLERLDALEVSPQFDAEPVESKKKA